MSRCSILQRFIALILAGIIALSANPVLAQTGRPTADPVCQGKLDRLQDWMTREMFELVATEMVEAGAPRVLASRPSREAVEAGWVLRVIDDIASAQADCTLNPDALDRFSQAEVRDSVKKAAATDRATCRALLVRIRDTATESYMRRSMGLDGSRTGAAQLRRTLFEDIWPICPDMGSEDLVVDTRTATSKDLSTARDAGQ